MLRYRLVKDGDLAKRRFERIILDEARLMKKIEGRMIQYLRMDRYDSVWFVTASPIMNTAKDLVNFLELLWSASGLPQVFQHTRKPCSLWEVYDPGYGRYVY